MKTTEEQANKIYDILVREAGANPDDWERKSFVYAHTNDKYPCQEYRFQGKLGFGGKFRRGRNCVDCYREDETPARLDIMYNTNQALRVLADNKEI